MAAGVEEQGQSGATINLLDAVALTDDYADNSSAGYRISPLSQLELIIDYTMDVTEVSMKALVKLLLSENGTNYREYAITDDQSPAGGFVESILYPRRFSVAGVAGESVSYWYAVPTSAKYMKVAAIESGSPSEAGILTVKARVSHDLKPY